MEVYMMHKILVGKVDMRYWKIKYGGNLRSLLINLSRCLPNRVEHDVRMNRQVNRGYSWDFKGNDVPNSQNESTGLCKLLYFIFLASKFVTIL